MDRRVDNGWALYHMAAVLGFTPPEWRDEAWQYEEPVCRSGIDGRCLTVRCVHSETGVRSGRLPNRLHTVPMSGARRRGSLETGKQASIAARAVRATCRQPVNPANTCCAVTDAPVGRSMDRAAFRTVAGLVAVAVVTSRDVRQWMTSRRAAVGVARLPSLTQRHHVEVILLHCDRGGLRWARGATGGAGTDGFAAGAGTSTSVRDRVAPARH